jgi:uncharacterized protein (DUF952 family)
MTGVIYHLTTRAAWDKVHAAGAYTADSLTSQGFIHCSREDQILRVANANFHGETGLVLLEIDLAHLQPALRWEPGTDKPDELFPHLYGPLNLDAVLRVLDFPPGPDGSFTLPPL